MKIRSFTVLVYKEEDMYITECPEVGTVDQGETMEEAIAHSGCSHVNTLPSGRIAPQSRVSLLN